jgi:hypothetical protein
VNREQLAHVLRAASSIVTDRRILVIGSQSILATYDEEELPVEATASIEVDLAFFDDDDDEARADQVDGAIGELSQFHETFGFYAQGVSVKTAVLPKGWRDRVVMWSNSSTGSAAAAFLDPHDCVVSKLVAFRDKDRAFAAALLRAGLVNAATLRERIGALPDDVDARVAQAILAWLAANDRAASPLDGPGAALEES